MRVHRIDTIDRGNGDNGFSEFVIDNFEGAVLIGVMGLISAAVAAGGVPTSSKPNSGAGGATSEEILHNSDDVVQIGFINTGVDDYITVKTGFFLSMDLKPLEKRKVVVRYKVQDAGFVEIMTHYPGELTVGFNAR